MRKWRGPVLFLAAALLLGSAAMAADNLLRANVPAVIYDAGTEEFSFSIPGRGETPDTDADDLFPNFKALMPGDTETQTVQVAVRNIPDGQQVEVFLHAEVPEDDKDVLAPITMTVAQSGDPVAEPDAVPIALRRETSLGLFFADGVSDLDVTLQVPVTVDAFQGTEGRVNWVFTAQTLPKHSGIIYLHPVDITSYAGSDDMPTLRFQVLMGDGKPWSGKDITFTLHQPGKNPAEVALKPTRVPGSKEGYYAFPVLEEHLDLTGSGGLGGAMQWKNLDDSDGHAGRYGLALDTLDTWYIDAQDAAGNFYAVQVNPKGTRVSVRPVANEEGAQALTPVIHSESMANTNAGGQDAVYGGHRAVAVIPANAAYYTNGRNSGLGLYGGPEQSGAPSIALLFDKPVALSDDLQPEDMAALMKDHAGHAGEWGGAGFSFEGWQSDFRYLDLVNTADGNAWVACDKPVVIYWPYPAGVRDHYQDYEFQILHYIGVDREYFQIPLDDAERWGQTVLCDAHVPVQSLAVTAEARGLRFTLPADPEGESFSPFALLWREKGGTRPNPPSTPDGPGDDDDDDDDDGPVRPADTPPGTPGQPTPGNPGQPTPGASGQPAPSGPQADSASGASPQSPRLPQTGQAWWPVFLMAAAGAVLLLIGLNMGKTGKGKHEA